MLGLDETGLQVLFHPTGTTTARAFDHVVLAVPEEPDDDLYIALRDTGGIPVHRIGDCVAPRRAHAAVIEGDRIGRNL